MAGPGSPSYALRQWTDGPIPAALAGKLQDVGVLTMASAAALTLGVATIPVYEIYKVGEDPHWLEGLDLLGPATGLSAAVVPHYDNAEGGNHDTRFCYMGERRLRTLEADLPADTFILGVDSHTALVLDLERGSASVAGLGGATIRGRRPQRSLSERDRVPIATLADLARQLAAGDPVDIGPTHMPRRAGGMKAGPRAGRARAPVRDEMSRLEGTFVEALRGRHAGSGVGPARPRFGDLGAVRRGEDSPDLDNATATFRALIARLGERAADGPRDARPLLEPFVETLLELRARARAGSDWETADLIRDRLTSAGVEVRDAADEFDLGVAGHVGRLRRAGAALSAFPPPRAPPCNPRTVRRSTGGSHRRRTRAGVPARPPSIAASSAGISQVVPQPLQWSGRGPRPAARGTPPGRRRRDCGRRVPAPRGRPASGRPSRGSSSGRARPASLDELGARHVALGPRQDLDQGAALRGPPKAAGAKPVAHPRPIRERGWTNDPSSDIGRSIGRWSHHGAVATCCDMVPAGLPLDPAPEGTRNPCSSRSSPPHPRPLPARRRPRNPAHRARPRDPPRHRLGPHRRDHRHHEHDRIREHGGGRACRPARRDGRPPARPRRPRRGPRPRCRPAVRRATPL